MNKKQVFINKIKNEAMKGYEKYKILPSLTLAQGALESGWGEKSIGNNIFGIKADKNWKGKTKTVRTREYINGVEVYVDAVFRDYNSIEECLKDRFEFLSKPRYVKVVGAKDYKTACLEIWKAGYATDPKYAELLINIIEQNKLYEFDEMVKERQVKVPVLQVVSPWAFNDWTWAISKGYVDGTRPKAGLTREEFALILRRVVS